MGQSDPNPAALRTQRGSRYLFERGLVTGSTASSDTQAILLRNYHGTMDDREDLLSAADKRLLLQVALQAIASRISGRSPDRPADVPEHLKADGAVFVTLHIGTQLRGCIGTIRAYQPLIDSVVDNAIKSGFEDPRFPPLTEEEFTNINLEISYLTPPQPVDSADEIEIGRHGIVLENGNHRGVFLPQVATEHGWDKETTLDHLSCKAGLSNDGWQSDGTQLSLFETISFQTE